jgi:hypothetical protein
LQLFGLKTLKTIDALDAINTVQMTHDTTQNMYTHTIHNSEEVNNNTPEGLVLFFPDLKHFSSQAHIAIAIEV